MERDAGSAAEIELKVVGYRRHNRTAVITLNRPERGNSWTGRMETEYRWCLADADADPEVRVIVVTGAGSKFCVGGDSQALEGHRDKGTYDRGLPEQVSEPGFGVAPEFDQPIASHFGLNKPVIGALNGSAAGIGLALAAFCDLRFAAAGAKFTTAHGKLGLPAEYGLSWILPRQIGLTRAMDLLLTSRVFEAEEAYELGFVNRVLPADEVLDAALAYADELAAGVAAGSLRATRHQVYRDLHRDAASSVADSLRLLTEMMAHPEFAEGVKALVEKRPPNF